MKKLKYLLAPLACALILAACEKENIEPLPTLPTSGKAYVRIIHASAYAVNSPMRISVNDRIVSQNITYSYPFPSGGQGTQGNNYAEYYLGLDPGVQNIKFYVPNVGATTDSIVRASVATSAFEAGKYYNVYVSDTSTNTKVLVVEENTARVDTGGARFKFVNLIPNLPSADLYYGPNKVASAVAYNTVSPDFTLSWRDTARAWEIRPAGAAPTSAALARYPTGANTTFVVLNQRALTVYSRGYVGASGNRAPAISLHYNLFFVD